MSGHTCEVMESALLGRHPTVVYLPSFPFLTPCPHAAPQPSSAGGTSPRGLVTSCHCTVPHMGPHVCQAQRLCPGHPSSGKGSAVVPWGWAECPSREGVWAGQLPALQGGAQCPCWVRLPQVMGRKRSLSSGQLTPPGPHLKNRKPSPGRPSAQRLLTAHCRGEDRKSILG